MDLVSFGFHLPNDLNTEIFGSTAQESQFSSWWRIGDYYSAINTFDSRM
jgi:hypothetical protein